MLKLKRNIMVTAFTATLVAAAAGNARADEYVAILLDQTGSMCADTTPCPAGMPWQNAVDDAKGWVQSDSDGGTNSPLGGATQVQRFYAIFTFKNTQDGTQTNAAKLWPTSTFNTNCTGTNGTVDANSGFCKLNKSTRAYADLQTVLESLKTMSGQVPQPTWLTPLADGVCRALSNVWITNGNANRTVILESDGGENDSDQSIVKCFGPGSTANINSITDLQAAKTAGTPDWGFSQGSWQANVMRRGARLIAFNAGMEDTAEMTAVQAGPLVKTENFPTLLTMRVSVNYTLCGAGDTDPVCTLNATTTQSQALVNPNLAATRAALPASPANAALKIDGTSVSPAASPTFAALAAPGTPATVAAAATVTRTPTIKPAELGFFRSLGKINARSQLREVVRDPSVVFGTTHKLAGDVDDSGCTDIADFSIVTQKGVWMQRAVQPNQLAIRADLDRDGWVNEHDRTIVLNNWGLGCKNSPGPKPQI